MSAFEKWLRRAFKHKEIGWTEIGEKFTRYSLLKSKWLNIYLHQLYAPTLAPKCHDHPWWFIAILIWPGYIEQVGDTFYQRKPGNVLYRPATFTHNVQTPFGTSWSLVITGSKGRDWGFKPCDQQKDTNDSETASGHAVVK